MGEGRALGIARCAQGAPLAEWEPARGHET